MYPVLPFGPITIPTSPIVALIAVTVGLELAGRYGRRLHLHIDDVWNTGLTTLLFGLIVARLWNVIQFWPIYVAEPWLIISLRPSGFALLPGVIGGIVSAYVYMIRHALSPVRVITALGVGITAGAALIFAGTFLTGEIIGLPSSLPWALAYYGEKLHPVALYYAAGIGLVLLWQWLQPLPSSPVHILLQLCFGVALVLLTMGAYEDQAAVVVGWRLIQLVGLVTALITAFLLAQLNRTSERRLPDDLQQIPVMGEGSDAESR